MDALLNLAGWVCGGIFLLTLAALILMHLPNSPLRTIALRATAGIYALFMPVYVISPVDLLPEAALGPIGLIDDLAVVITGIAAGRYALKGPDPEGKGGH